MIDLIGYISGDALRRTELGNRTKINILVGVILMRKHCRNIVARGKQRFDTDAAKIVIRKNNRSHAVRLKKGSRGV